jgi:hypothetical protein
MPPIFLCMYSIVYGSRYRYFKWPASYWLHLYRQNLFRFSLRKSARSWKSITGTTSQIPSQLGRVGGCSTYRHAFINRHCRSSDVTGNRPKLNYELIFVGFKFVVDNCRERNMTPFFSLSLTTSYEENTGSLN